MLVGSAARDNNDICAPVSRRNERESLFMFKNISARSGGGGWNSVCKVEIFSCFGGVEVGVDFVVGSVVGCFLKNEGKPL